MRITCPRCHHENESIARFCALCGLSLAEVGEGRLRPAMVRRPDALPKPAEFVAVVDAPNVYYRAQAPGGGRALLATEGFEIELFNAGYVLADVRMKVRGWDDRGTQQLETVHELARLPVGEIIKFEVASWELQGEVERLELILESAAFAEIDPH